VWDEAGQAGYICEKVLEVREEGTVLKQQAVLFRASHHSGPLEVELTRRNIPFVKFGGLKFLDAAHVKDVLAVLRLAENPRDRVAGFRVLQLISGIGPSAAQQAIDAMEASADVAVGLSTFRPPARTVADWPAFVKLFTDLRKRCRGQRRLSAHGSGMSRIWSAATMTLGFAILIFFNWNRSPQATLRDNTS
jgi:DNA helicase II / ATP-dependent DNA helicase PcrA